MRSESWPVVDLTCCPSCGAHFLDGTAIIALEATIHRQPFFLTRLPDGSLRATWETWDYDTDDQCTVGYACSACFHELDDVFSIALSRAIKNSLWHVEHTLVFRPD